MAGPGLGWCRSGNASHEELLPLSEGFVSAAGTGTPDDDTGFLRDGFPPVTLVAFSALFGQERRIRRAFNVFTIE